MSGSPNLYLIGYRGSGKTTVARELAAILGWECRDADDEIERRAGCTIQRMFAEQGEPAFRDLETAVLADFATATRHVYSLGGGAILRADNRDRMRASGRTAWLRARAATLAERLALDPTTGARRPNLTVAGGLAEIEQLLAIRAPLYQSAADYIVEADERTPREIAAEIAKWVRGL
jgi:shikimate kinase